MINHALSICRDNPQILVFLALGLGYVVGNLKYRGFSPGATTGVLLAALVLGQVNVEVSQVLKNLSFALFIFCIGYRVGPQFFGALRKQGLTYVWLSLAVALTALSSALVLAKFLGFDAGTAAGFFAGSVTQSAALGTAEGAIRQLLVPAAEKLTLETHTAVAYTITYVFGTVGGIMFFKVAPALLGINLKDEAQKLQKTMSGNAKEEQPGLFSWTRQLCLRAYSVTHGEVIGKTVAELEGMFQPERVAIDTIKRGDMIIKAGPDSVIEANDSLMIIAEPGEIVSLEARIGPEIAPGRVMDVTGESLEVCVLNKTLAGKTLGEISGLEFLHGIFLKNILHQGNEVPVTRDTVVHRCDILHLIGAKEDVERAVKVLGFPERPVAVTDMVMVGIGCVLGTLLGLVAIPVAGIPISLGLGGGVLCSGLVFGWLRTLHPTFGQIPAGGQWILQNLGLNLFIACVGLGAGPRAIEAMQGFGVSVLLAGMAVCLMPFIVGLLFGKFVLRMNPVLLLGALTGARVITAALNTLQDDADSTAPALGFAIPFAFGNVLLTICGSLMVNLM
ncbi:MAG: aspartate-alanine antiporter [Spirochaetes bacterium]|nr:aspartate-alanine antiporter [Spirochaetota bacterium]